MGWLGERHGSRRSSAAAQHGSPLPSRRRYRAVSPVCAGRPVRRHLVALFLRYVSSGTLHEGLHLLEGEAAVFFGVHCIEDALVGRLELLQ